MVNGLAWSLYLLTTFLLELTFKYLYIATYSIPGRSYDLRLWLKPNLTFMGCTQSTQAPYHGLEATRTL